MVCDFREGMAPTDVSAENGDVMTLRSGRPFEGYGWMTM